MATGNIAILTLTVVSVAAVAANRFLKQDGSYPAAGGKAFGVTRFEALGPGEPLSLDILGTTIVEAGAAVPFDTDLMTDAAGKVVPLTAGKVCVGRSMEAAPAAGAQIEILLIPTGAAA